MLNESADGDKDEFVDSQSSDGRTTPFEGKVHMSPRNLSQLIATCVVSSFIEKNLHPKLSSSCQPFLLIVIVFV